MNFPRVCLAPFERAIRTVGTQLLSSPELRFTLNLATAESSSGLGPCRLEHQVGNQAQ
jgi:hypothetical protein